MATIVEHSMTMKRYILVGAGYGTFKTARAHKFFGTAAAVEKSGSYPMFALCDENGKIKWCKSSDCTIISVDGVNPDEALKSA